MLKFNGTWRFDSPGPMASAAVSDFSVLIGKVAAQGEQQRILEHFKSYFACAAGAASSWSSNASWAQTVRAKHSVTPRRPRNADHA